jgi:N-methylhydantoinase B
LGAEFAVRMRAALTLHANIERAHCPPWGLAGGRPGYGNKVTVTRGGALKDDYPNAKVFNTRLEIGDGFTVRPGGGGGFGAPWQRPAEAVREDVRQGYVTREAAAREYGVVLDAEGGEMEVDDAGTRERRAAMMKETTSP